MTTEQTPEDGRGIADAINTYLSGLSDGSSYVGTAAVMLSSNISSILTSSSSVGTSAKMSNPLSGLPVAPAKT